MTGLGGLGSGGLGTTGGGSPFVPVAPPSLPPLGQYDLLRQALPVGGDYGFVSDLAGGWPDGLPVYGTLGPVRLIVTDRGRTFEFTRDQRKRLQWSSVAPGGDESCTWGSPCTAHVLQNGMPRQWSKVEVRDDNLGRTLWVGRLKKPSFSVDQGHLAGDVEFEAEGYYHSAMDVQFDYALVYGIGSTGASSTGKVTVTTIEEAIEHARTTGAGEFIQASRLATFPAGALMAEDTENFAGKTAVDVWNAMQGYVSFISNPLNWQVYSIDNQITLEFFSHPGVPDWYDRGTAKYKIGYDASEIINRAVIEYGVDQRYPAAAPPVLGGTRSKYLNVVQEAKSLDLVRNLGDSIVQRYNRVRITEGDITITKDLWGHGNRVIRVQEMRAGRMILLDFPEEIYPYTGEAMYIRRALFDEESCTATLSPNLFNSSDKRDRMLPFVQGANRGLTWGITIPEFNPAHRDTGKIWGIGATIGGTRDPNLTPRTGFVQPSGVLSDSKHDAGPGGGYINPVNLPKNPLDFDVTLVPSQSATADAFGVVKLDGQRDAGRIGGQEGIVERISIKAKGGEQGAIRIDIDKFVRRTKQTIPNFLTISAGLGNDPNGAHHEVEYDSRDPVDSANVDHRKVIDQGDYLVYHVSFVGEGSTFTEITVGVHGRKRWSYIPEIKAGVNAGSGDAHEPEYVSRGGVRWPDQVGWHTGEP